MSFFAEFPLSVVCDYGLIMINQVASGFIYTNFTKDAAERCSTGSMPVIPK